MDPMSQEVFDAYFKQVFEEYQKEGNKPFPLGKEDVEKVYDIINYIVSNSTNSSQAFLTMRFLEKYLLHFYKDYIEFLKDPVAIQKAVAEIHILGQSEFGEFN